MGDDFLFQWFKAARAAPKAASPSWTVLKGMLAYFSLTCKAFTMSFFFLNRINIYKSAFHCFCLPDPAVADYD